LPVVGSKNNFLEFLRKELILLASNLNPGGFASMTDMINIFHDQERQPRTVKKLPKNELF
jgi:hypothetical protein